MSNDNVVSMPNVNTRAAEVPPQMNEKEMLLNIRMDLLTKKMQFAYLIDDDYMKNVPMIAKQSKIQDPTGQPMSEVLTPLDFLN